MKSAEVRFYFDADILGLGELVSGLRADRLPGDPGAVVTNDSGSCSITSPSTDGTVWSQRSRPKAC